MLCYASSAYCSCWCFAWIVVEYWWCKISGYILRKLPIWLPEEQTIEFETHWENPRIQVEAAITRWQSLLLLDACRTSQSCLFCFAWLFLKKLRRKRPSERATFVAGHCHNSELLFRNYDQPSWFLMTFDYWPAISSAPFYTYLPAYQRLKAIEHDQPQQQLVWNIRHFLPWSLGIFGRVRL